jgi:uncharacterized membrane protein
MGNRQSPIFVWLLLALGALAFLTLIVGAPVAAASSHGSVAGTIYAAFSKICHQLPERSFFIAGYPLAVCSRCTGLYFGFTLSLLTYPLIRSLRITTPPDRKWLFLAAAPMVVDVGVNLLGIWHNTHSSRLFTGLLLGAVGVFYVMPGISDLALHAFRRQAAPALLPTATAILQPESVPSAPSDYSAPHRRI